MDIGCGRGDFLLSMQRKGYDVYGVEVSGHIKPFIPGVLKKPEATINESFSAGLLEYPQYTRPEKIEELKVPEILLSGNHEEIAKWKTQKSQEKTKNLRPNLFTRTD